MHGLGAHHAVGGEAVAALEVLHRLGRGVPIVARHVAELHIAVFIEQALDIEHVLPPIAQGEGVGGHVAAGQQRYGPRAQIPVGQ